MPVEQTAGGKYKELYQELKELLSQIEEKIPAESPNPHDWGYTGDLGYITDQLDHLIAFIEEDEE